MTQTMTLIDGNPLLGDCHPPRFQSIVADHVVPAIAFLVGRCDEALAQVADRKTVVTSRELHELLDPPIQALEAAWSTVSHLKSVCDTPALREAFTQAQPKVTAFFNRLSSDERLYGLYKQILEAEGPGLDEANRRMFSNAIRDFRLSGADLDQATKTRFKETRLRSADLGRNFANNVLDATDAFVVWASESQLDGVPDDVKRALREAAKSEGRADDYRCGLQQATLGPILQYAHDRALREQLYRANVSRASELGPSERDNGPLLAEILALRHERARMLGHANHAEVSLADKMADSPELVTSFLRDLAARARGQAERDLDQLREFARAELGIQTLEPWDMAYAMEHMRRRRFDFSEQEVRQYFQLDRVLAAMFDIAAALFDVRIIADEQATWHPSVTAWRLERGGQVLGRFMLDPFARAGKQGNAWMNGAQPRWKRPDGTTRTALAYVVTNFAAPAQGLPALLTHANVVTLFHEFGHTLHFLLCQVDVLGVSGLSGVEWDAVELPSQLMENFAWDAGCLEKISAHVDTGTPLPRTLLDRLLAARNFLDGLFLLRQVEMSLFDMRIHIEPAAGSATAVQTLLDEVRAEVAVAPSTADNRFQCAFSHVFAGGYAAGYFSYLWAEVLEADAWSVFQSAGVLSRTAGQRYLNSILERGGSRPMGENFKEFVGRPPSIDALLCRRGLANSAAWQVSVGGTPTHRPSSCA